MWRPPERIKHALLDPGWPTSDEAARARWFSPIAVGRFALRERTWVPAMVPWRATEDGLVTPEVLEWYARFARGRPGGLVVEATGIRDIPSGPLLRIGHDRFIPGLRALVDRVREESGGDTRLFIQIIDFLAVRRRPVRETFFRRYLVIDDRHREALARIGDRGTGGRGDGGTGSPPNAVGADPCVGPILHARIGPTHGRATNESLSDDDVRDRMVALSDVELERVLDARELEALRFGYRERVTDVHLSHIRDLPAVLPATFAAAAARAEQAGFDGVELHYAHAYTMASFLSALNDRRDGYGGTLEHRLRLPLEVLDRVRQAVSDRFVVGCRFLADDCIAGGNTIVDSARIGVALAAAGMDFIALSRGGKFEDAKQPPIGWAVYPYTGPSGWECMPTTIADAAGPFGRNVDASAHIRNAIRDAGRETPVIVTGGIATFRQAEDILARGAADVIGAARQSLADPDWFRKVRLGRGSDVRRCTFTNYCEGLDQKHKQVTCKLWDRVGLEEPDVPLSSDGHRRLTAPAWEP